MSKELSVKSIKEELMTSLLDDVKILQLFSNGSVEKVSDLVGKNIFSYLPRFDTEEPLVIMGEDLTRVDSYIYFDVADHRGFNVMITVKSHRDLVSGDVVNCVDEISDVIEKIAKEVYPYHRCFSSIPKTQGKFVERHISFKLYPLDKDGYEKSIETENERVTSEVPRETSEN